MKLQVWIKVYCLLIGFRQHPDRNRASSRGREEALCRIVLPWVTQSSSVEFWIRDTRVLNPRSSTSLASATILHLRKVLRGTPVTSRASERLAPPFTREVTRTYLASMSGRENDRLFLLVWNVTVSIVLAYYGNCNIMRLQKTWSFWLRLMTWFEWAIV